jgi:peptide/nickel transport system permease protein
VTAAPASLGRRKGTWWAGHQRSGYALRRSARLAVSLVLLLTATFFMIHLIPGDPVRASLGPTAPASLVAQRKAALGLDKPLPTQYFDYVRNVLHGDFGTSLTSGESVTEVIQQRGPSTLKLGGIAFLIAISIAVPLGVLMAALTRDSRRRGVELGFTATTGAIASIPSFLIAIALVYLFAVTIRIFPVAGSGGFSAYVLPVAALALAPIASLSRIVRVEGLRVLGQDYIRTARGKRLPARIVYVRHALPNTLTPTLTLAGLLLGGLLAGTVLVENIFAWPGLGTTLVQSVVQKDYPTVQAVAVVFGAVVLLANFAVDLALGFIDPRSTILDS